MDLPDRFDNLLGIPSAAAGSHSVSKLGFDVTIPERVGKAAARRCHRFGNCLARHKEQGNARRTVRHGIVEFRPHLFPKLRHIRPDYGSALEFGNSCRTNQQTAGDAMMNADAGIALISYRAVSSRQQQSRPLHRHRFDLINLSIRLRSLKQASMMA